MPSGTTRFLTSYAVNRINALDAGPLTLSAFDANFPLSNQMQSDRYLVSSYLGGSDLNLYVDLGNTKTFSYFGLFNVSTSAVTPYQFRIYTAPTTASYTQTGCITALGSSTMTSPASLLTLGVAVGDQVTHAGVDLNGTIVKAIAGDGLSCTLSSPATGAATNTASFWRYTYQTLASGNIGVKDGADIYTYIPGTLTARRVMVMALGAGSGFSFGSLLFGQPTTDLGIAFSRGSKFNYSRTRVSAPTVNGLLVRSETGRPHYEFNLVFNSVPQSTRDTLFNIYKSAPPIYLLDAYGAVYQTDAMEDSFAWTALWGAPDLYDVALGLRGLP
jgi:hypothetical protein